MSYKMDVGDGGEEMRMGKMTLILMEYAVAMCIHIATAQYTRTDEYSGNPINDHMYTTDPSVLVYEDTIYLFTGHDEAGAGVEEYIMNDWHVFSSADIIDWTGHGELLTLNHFSWAFAHACAGDWLCNM